MTVFIGTTHSPKYQNESGKLIGDAVLRREMASLDELVALLDECKHPLILTRVTGQDLVSGWPWWGPELKPLGAAVGDIMIMIYDGPIE